MSFVLRNFSTRDRRDQHDLIAILDGRIHTLQVFDVVLAYEQIHERTQVAAFVEQVRLDGGELRGQVGQRLRDLCAGHVDFALSAGIGAQGCWDSQGCHGFYFSLISFYELATEFTEVLRKNSENSVVSVAKVLYKQLYISIGGIFKEGRRAANFSLRDKVFFLEAKDIHGHLAADQAYIQLQAGFT